MFRCFFPDGYAESVFDIPYDALKSNGIFNLLFDVDNTLAPVASPEPDPAIADLFMRLKSAGFNICLLSNGGHGRAERFAGPLGVPFIAKAKKPAVGGLESAMRVLSARTADTAIIGDQIFTDILCGRRGKIHTVLVRPVAKNEQWYIKIKRMLEAPVLADYHAKRRQAR